MRPPRFSIAALLAIVAVCALAFASIRSPSYLWANVAFTTALAALVVAAINVVFSRRAPRAFWTGFLITGGAYFAICSVPGLRESVCPRLATEALLDVLYPLVAPPAPVAAPTTVTVLGNWTAADQGASGSGGSGGGYTSAMMGGYGLAPASVPPPPPPSRWAAWTAPDRASGVGFRIGTVALVSSEPYRQIGHSLLTLLVGFLGALYARRRDARRDPAGHETTD